MLTAGASCTVTGEHPNATARQAVLADEHDVLGNDIHVCALSIMGVRRDGVDVQTRVVSFFHYVDCRQVERWIHPEDPVAWEQIFAA